MMKCRVDNTNSDAFADVCAQGNFSDAASNRHPVVVFYTAYFCVGGVDLQGIFFKPTYVFGSSGLGADVVLAEYPPCCQQQRELAVRCFAGWLIIGEDKKSLATHKTVDMHDRCTLWRAGIAGPLNTAMLIQEIE